MLHERLEDAGRDGRDVRADGAALLRVEGLGPRRVQTLYEGLGITTLDVMEPVVRIMTGWAAAGKGASGRRMK